MEESCESSDHNKNLLSFVAHIFGVCILYLANFSNSNITKVSAFVCLMWVWLCHIHNVQFKARGSRSEQWWMICILILHNNNGSESKVLYGLDKWNVTWWKWFGNPQNASKREKFENEVFPFEIDCNEIIPQFATRIIFYIGKKRTYNWRYICQFNSKLPNHFRLWNFCYWLRVCVPSLRMVCFFYENYYI